MQYNELDMTLIDVVIVKNNMEIYPWRHPGVIMGNYVKTGRCFAVR